MTIKEIAKLSGVSRTTVSRVMNNTGYTRQEVKDRVLRVIHETGYIPNARAKSLRKMKADTIGVIIPDFEKQFITQLISTIEHHLERANFQMLITSTKDVVQNATGALKNLVGSYVDGVILMQPYLNDEIEEIISAFPKPIVYIGLSESSAVSIVHSDWNAYYKMAKHLIDKGHKNIAFCNSIPVNTEEKCKAIESALKENGLSLNSGWIFEGNEEIPEIENRKQIIKNIFQVGTLPSGFIVDDDLFAIDFIRELKSRNLGVPSDVAVISFGDTKIATLLEPELTSCNVNHKKIGELASSTILKLINNEIIKEKTIYVEPYIIERAST